MEAKWLDTSTTPDPRIERKDAAFYNPGCLGHANLNKSIGHPIIHVNLPA